MAWKLNAAPEVVNSLATRAESYTDVLPAYSQGKIVWHDGAFYRALNDIPEKKWDYNDWEFVILADCIAAGSIPVDSLLNQNAAARVYNPATSYKEGDFCTDGSRLYRANKPTTGLPRVTADWNEVRVTDLLKDKVGNENVTVTYDPIQNYTKGDTVMYDGKLYRAEDDVYGGDPKPDVNPNWTNLTLVELVEGGSEQPLLEVSASDVYDESKMYYFGDICVYKGRLYVANSMTTSTFNAAKWDAITLEDLIKQKTDHSVVAPLFSAGSTYAAGDFVMNDGMLYKALVDIDTPHDFLSSEWSYTNVMSNIKNTDFYPEFEDFMKNFCVYLGFEYTREVDALGKFVRYKDFKNKTY